MIRTRKYRPLDRPAVEKVNFETGFLGKSLAELGISRKLVSSGISYYLDKEPDAVFVAEDDAAGVVGYIFGCLDSSRHNEKTTIIKRTLINLLRLPFLPKKERQYVMNQLLLLVKAGTGRSEEAMLKTPPGAGHLHINLLSGFRGQGMGTDLLNAFINYAKGKGVKCIYANAYQTELNPNQHFWQRNGFKEYSKVRTLYWQKYYPDETIFFVCYIKETG